MREAVGGGWLLGVVVVFVVLFSGFLAVSINYTKAFKVKNQIINILEEKEGFETTSATDMNCTDEDNSECLIRQYLDSIGYATAADITCPKDYYSNGKGDTIEARTGGYCIRRIDTGDGVYYKVTTFVMIELPFVVNKFTVPVTGETSIIRNDDNSNSEIELSE